MKPYFFLLLLLAGKLYAQTALPQQQLLRQRLSALDTTRTPDSRALALFLVSEAFYQNNLPDSVLKYSQLAENLCREHQFSQVLGRTLMGRARVLVNTGDFQAMLPLLTEAARLFELVGDTYRQASAMGNIANAYVSLGQTDNAFAMYQSVARMMTALNDTVGTADCTLNMGLIFEDEPGKEATTLQHLDEAIRLYSSVPAQEQGLAIAYNAKGNVLRRQGQKKEAIGHYLLAVQAARVVNDKYVIVDIYNALADTYIENKEYENALRRIEEALKICDEIGYVRGAMDLRTSRAMLHAARKEYDQAIALYQVVLADAQKTEVKNVILSCYAGMSETYHKMLQHRKARHYERLAANLREEMRLHPDRSDADAP